MPERVSHNWALQSRLPLSVIAFYKFLPLTDLPELRRSISALGNEHGLRGTILLASEGVNGTLAASEDAIQSFLASPLVAEAFGQLDPKVSQCESMPFRRWRVRLKKEIVTMKVPSVDPLQGVGAYVEPEMWNEVISTPDVALVDVRNDYEIQYGTFKGAINPQTDDFWEFPHFAETQLLDKNKPVALFCTGGIRCEKASAYLLAKGYTNVMHLKGGILNYLEHVPVEQSLWQGNCFVFDDRVALDHDLLPIQRTPHSHNP